ncbi:zinc finger protein 471-like [Cylas formicarius]|uniref:zinc finger protein 471-like n=1 Tax=Cylas formicarius TaxID=197179 RepID=UPI0029589EF0|nr:zinc finger protein 471-like [Cylas formicarius]
MMESDSGRELLENVVINGETDAPQYIRLSETSQIISTELLQQPNGLVVDLAGNDFIPVTYTSDDLLSQELTEEDRNLAAALVAVQLSQQQKQQQLHDASLPIVAGSKILEESQLILSQDKNSGASSYLRIVNSDNLYVEQQGLHKLVDNVRLAGTSAVQNDYVEELPKVIITKTEEERGGDSDRESVRNEHRTLKKSLPHKKRISRKLRKNSTLSVKKFVCNSCDQTFSNDDECAEHEAACQTARASSVASPFSCQLCNTSFQDQLKFFEHLKKHYEPGGGGLASGEPEAPKKLATPPKAEKKSAPEENQPQETLLSSLLSLTCIECNKTFRRQKTFEAHMRDVHTNKNEPLDEFSEPEDMMADINVVVDNDLDDDNDEEDDSKAWYREEDLHQTEEDLKELEDKNEHVCHICKQPFALRAILLQHLVTCRVVSGNMEPTPAVIVRKKNKRVKEKLNCSECDRVFKHRNSLVYHMRSHTGIRPHQCELCGKSFFASSALKVHLRLHSGDKPYDCEHCGRKFRQWGDLKYHKTSIHSTEKQYQCEYCGKEFARKYSLVVHRRIHTGERNYKCEYCGKSFRASSYLQNHRKIHTGEKPHNCSLCGKPFRVRSDMKRHEKTHGKAVGQKTSGNAATKVFKVHKSEVEENDESNELHIGEEEEAAEHILEEYAQPDSLENINAMGISKRNLYTNGHELFLVTYPNEIAPRTTVETTANWIHTTNT